MQCPYFQTQTQPAKSVKIRTALNGKQTDSYMALKAIQYI